MKKPITILFAVLFIAAAIYIPVFIHSPRGAETAFLLHRAAFDRAAASALASRSGDGVKRPAGVNNIAVWSNPYGEGEYVDFEMGASGFASQTSYWGVTFSRNGPVGFQGEALEAGLDGWYWEEPDGDNWSRVTRLAENWYLYEMHF